MSQLDYNSGTVVQLAQFFVYKIPGFVDTRGVEKSRYSAATRSQSYRQNATMVSPVLNIRQRPGSVGIVRLLQVYTCVCPIIEMCATHLTWYSLIQEMCPTCLPHRKSIQ